MADRPQLSDQALRARALQVLEGNYRDGYTVPAQGLYPFQWCWDSAPIALGWAAAGQWERAWGELHKLLSAQWPSGMVPHIVFWKRDDGYFPGPEVWDTGRDPGTSGVTQPPLAVSAAAQLFATDPDRARARQAMHDLWPGLMAWLDWIDRARTGPHGAAVVVHPWESGMDNSPSWDDALSVVPEVDNAHIDRRDLATLAAAERPSQREYREYLGIVAALRAAGWDTERQTIDSPFAVEDPCFSAITARAASDMVEVAAATGLDGRVARRVSAAARAGLEALWDDEAGWFRSYDLRSGRWNRAFTSPGVVALWAGVSNAQAARIADRLDAWAQVVACGVPTTDPTDPSFDAVRYWRGPVWVLVNWLVAGGLARSGFDERAGALRKATRALVDEHFSEYYNPHTAAPIGSHDFSWSAALTLAWLT